MKTLVTGGDGFAGAVGAETTVGGGDPPEGGYSDSTPVISSWSSVIRVVSHPPEYGHIVARSAAEWPSPKTCPNSCVPVFSMKYPFEHPLVVVVKT